MYERERLVALILGYAPSQLVHATVALGLADALDDTPRPVDELALTTDSQPAMLARLLRGLAAIGLAAGDERGGYRATDMTTLLRSDGADSLRGMVLHFGGEAYPAWSGLGQAVRRGGTAFEAVLGEKFFDYMRDRPDAGAAFNATMTALSLEVVAELVATYDFSGRSGILDVGGGQGHVVAAVLEAHPELTGAVIDLPQVIDSSARVLESRGLADRCRVVAGSFFDGLPSGFDTHILKWILHDWNDESCVSILTSCRQALPDDGRLLVVERLLPEEVQSTSRLDATLFSDLNMLVNFGEGARERSLGEYDGLFAQSGFSRARVRELGSGHSLVEAELVRL